jgi:hypothetical protein
MKHSRDVQRSGSNTCPLGIEFASVVGDFGDVFVYANDLWH